MTAKEVEKDIRHISTTDMEETREVENVEIKEVRREDSKEEAKEAAKPRVAPMEKQPKAEEARLLVEPRPDAQRAKARGVAMVAIIVEAITGQWIARIHGMAEEKAHGAKHTALIQLSRNSCRGW